VKRSKRKQGNQSPQRLGGRLFDRLRRGLSRLFGAGQTSKAPAGAKSNRNRAHVQNQARQLHKAMISGFGSAAAEKLELLKVNRRSDRVGDAAWALALWYGSIADYRRALDHLIMRRLALKRDRPSPAHLSLQVKALMNLGRLKDAEKTVADSIVRRGESIELCLCAANVFAANPLLLASEGDRVRLEWLNKPLTSKGLAPIALKDGSRLLAIDNIAAPSAEPHPRSGEAKVSVLMPAYNASETIAYAMDGVLNQTWENLELIVVDDGSTDDTLSIIKSMAERDARVVPVRHEKNRGAYPARNTALRRATGDFVTVNDADDWSHPERVAVQVIDLMDVGDRVLNTTMLVRVQPNLDVFIKPDGGTRFQNYSSLMTRRENVLDVGGWDEVRMGADAELYERLLAKLDARRAILHTDAFLSFAAARGDSLTRRQDLGIATIRYGPRRGYIESYEYWHRLESSKTAPDWTMHPAKRRFPIPNICRLSPRSLEYDVLLVSDFSLPGGTTSSNVNLLRAAKALGLRCACYHWPRIDQAGMDLNPKIRQLLHEGIAESVVAGEEVECDLVMVNHPPLLNQFPDRRLQVTTKACVVIVNQAPMSRSEGGREMYELDKILENACSAFGVAPMLAPLSPLIRRILQTTAQNASTTELDWTPLIDTAQYRRAHSLWDGARSPVIGRHGRDHEDKWLSEPESLRHAYCAGAPFEVRLLGGADRAAKLLGGLPDNWTVLPFDSVDIQEFLKGLDFFVHYPHEDCIEAFGRAPLEAIATGVPAILPPHFEETFADAAVYAEPADVFNTIQTLWADREAYEAQVRRGYAFVEASCSLANFGERIKPFVPQLQ